MTQKKKKSKQQPLGLDWPHHSQEVLPPHWVPIRSIREGLWWKWWLGDEKDCCVLLALWINGFCRQREGGDASSERQENSDAWGQRHGGTWVLEPEWSYFWRWLPFLPWPHPTSHPLLSFRCIDNLYSSMNIYFSFIKKHFKKMIFSPDSGERWTGVDGLFFFFFFLFFFNQSG